MAASAGSSGSVAGVEDVRDYLARARARSEELGAQIEAFSSRVVALRALGAQVESLTSRIAPQVPRGQTAPPSHAHGEWLRAHVVRQDEELVLAREELLAQHEALKEAHAELERERERYVDLFEHAPDAYVTTDGRGTIREANLAAATLLGVVRSVLPGKLLIAFVARGDTRPFRDRLNELAQGNGQHVLSLKLRARGGRPFPATVSVRSIRGPDGVVDMRFTMRPVIHAAPESEADLLRATAEELRASFDGHGAPMLQLVEDVEYLAHSAGELPREAVTPAEVVWRALGRARAQAGAGNVRLSVGSLEEGVVLQLVADRAVWALARLVLLVGEAKLRGWREEGRYLLELSSEAADASFHRGRLARAAVRAAFAAEGVTMRVTEPPHDGASGLVCEIAFPVGPQGESTDEIDGAPPSSEMQSARGAPDIAVAKETAPAPRQGPNE